MICSSLNLRFLMSAILLICGLPYFTLVRLARDRSARLKYLQEARTHHQMLSFNVGDRVRFHPPGHDPKTGVIIKYNRKTVTVLTDAQHQWNVAPVFLSRVVDAPSTETATATADVIRLPTKS